MLRKIAKKIWRYTSDGEKVTLTLFKGIAASLDIVTKGVEKIANT